MLNFRKFKTPAYRVLRRFFASKVDGAGSAARTTPLSETLPGLPTAVYASSNSCKHETRITTLENGLRVASENRYGKFCTVGGNS